MDASPQTGPSGAAGVAALMAEARAGDERAVNRLHDLLAGELRDLARILMRQQRPGHTLQTTALVNEAYLRLVGQDDAGWASRAQFFSLAARAMRSVLIDHARARGAEKRGGGWRRAPLDDVALVSDNPAVEMLALNEALDRLAALDPVKARIVELRFFGGLDVETTARILELGTATVKRQWRLAKAWLHQALTDGSPDDA